MRARKRIMFAMARWKDDITYGCAQKKCAQCANFINERALTRSERERRRSNKGSAIHKETESLSFDLYAGFVCVRIIRGPFEFTDFTLRKMTLHTLNINAESTFFFQLTANIDASFGDERALITVYASSHREFMESGIIFACELFQWKTKRIVSFAPIETFRLCGKSYFNEH